MVTAKELGELGYKMQFSTWSREDLSRMTTVWVPHPMFDSGFQVEMIINEQDVWQILIRESKVEIIHAYKGSRSFGIIDMSEASPKNHTDFKPIMEFERLFFGNIADVSELIKVMQQTGCPYISNA